MFKKYLRKKYYVLLNMKRVSLRTGSFLFFIFEMNL